MKLLITIIFLTPFLAFGSKLSDFETDYCTNYPEGTREEPELWKHCCLLHDLYFWAGGTRRDRDVADLELRSCIEETGAHHHARLMYYAVRAGSYSPIKYPKYQWSNGWKDGRGMIPLTSEDIDLIEEKIFNGHDYIAIELKWKLIQSLRKRSEISEVSVEN